jgi:hypothetical protein
MKSATVTELKQALQEKSGKEVVELCLRLSRFKKENKELLTYLLFESENESAYIEMIKEEIDQNFEEIPSSINFYLRLKKIRKVLRTITRYIRYTGSPVAEASILLHFCKKLRNSGIDFKRSTALQNLYDNQMKKIKKAVSGMHEDLQADFDVDF